MPKQQQGRTDPVRSSKSRITREYQGINQGFDAKDILINEREDNREDTQQIQTWTDDSFKETKTTDQEYYCFKCQYFLIFARIKDTYYCKNNRCIEYLNFINIKQRKHPKLLTIDMAEVSSETDDEPWITSISQEELNKDYTLYDRKTVTYESQDSRVQHIRWRGFPKSLDVKTNSR